MKKFFPKRKKTNEVSSLRIYLLAGVALIFTLIIIGRLFWWQIIMHETLKNRAENQHIIKKTTEATRGKILAANNEILATNNIVYKIAVIPKKIKNPTNFSRQIAPFIEQDPLLIKEKLLKNPNYLILQHRMNKEMYEKLSQEKIEDLIIHETIGRYYPAGEITAPLLGFVNLKNQGQYSLEEFFNGILSGKAGTEYQEVDTKAQAIPLGNRQITKPEDGAIIVTTIDPYLQQRLFSILKDGIERYKAKKGVILVMNPQTGEIPAMVSYPSYDPNNYAKYFEAGKAELFINPNLQQFEPGSIFKVITLAAGLDSETVSANSTIYDTGKLEIDKKTIYNAGHAAYGNTSMTNILVWSSNIGAASVAMQMGRNVFDKYIKSFGFGKKTGIELIGEEAGIVYRPERWSNLDLASIGFGQAIAVTPIQMLTAFCAIANGGNLFKPMLVKKIIEKEKVNEEVPRIMRKVIRNNTAKTLNEMLIESVKSGYAKRGAISGYQVAGKTGTAQIASPKGGYDKTEVVGSFIGYAPAENPSFAMLVSLYLSEETKIAERWGEYTAAPLFSEAGKIILQHMGIAPTS